MKQIVKRCAGLIVLMCLGCSLFAGDSTGVDTPYFKKFKHEVQLGLTSSRVVSAYGGEKVLNGTRQGFHYSQLAFRYGYSFHPHWFVGVDYSALYNFYYQRTGFHRMLSKSLSGSLEVGRNMFLFVHPKVKVDLKPSLGVGYEKAKEVIFIDHGWLYFNRFYVEVEEDLIMVKGGLDLCFTFYKHLQLGFRMKHIYRPNPKSFTDRYTTYRIEDSDLIVFYSPSFGSYPHNYTLYQPYIGFRF